MTNPRPSAKQIRDSFEQTTLWGQKPVEAKAPKKPLKREAA